MNRSGWQTRELSPELPVEAPRSLAPGEIPAELVHLAWLLDVPVEHVLRNPRSYTPRTHGTGDPSSGHIDPCKLME